MGGLGEKRKEEKGKEEARFIDFVKDSLWISSGVIPTSLDGLEVKNEQEKSSNTWEGGGASRQPAPPKRVSEVYPLGTWPAIVNVLENWEPRFRHKIVRWMHPPDGWYKCNTDVASKGRRIPNSTSLVAEAVAIKEGIKFCIDRNLLPLIVETDSHTMVQLLEERWEVSWSVVMEVEAIKRMRENIPIHVKHTLREGNTLADFFANMTVNFAGFQSHSQQLLELRKSLISTILPEVISESLITMPPGSILSWRYYIWRTTRRASDLLTALQEFKKWRGQIWRMSPTGKLPPI
ncbi:hypothetical protein KY285_030681 [Solanum tuberosum]|nr:hypothetical protein KY284_031730 [Solanum tuberosum]KAH0655799.1 hypothetical protein KY285_030681 [Solanum tuberosum]